MRCVYVVEHEERPGEVIPVAAALSWGEADRRMAGLSAAVRKAAKVTTYVPAPDETMRKPAMREEGL